jgi:hypothetical protein
VFIADSAQGWFAKAGESGLLFWLRGVENSGKTPAKNGFGIMEQVTRPDWTRVRGLEFCDFRD